MRNLRLFVILGIFLFGLTMSAQAVLYLSSGDFRFNVTYRNQWSKDISKAQGWVKISGENARIDIESPGYYKEFIIVRLKPGQSTYDVKVCCEELDFDAEVVDYKMKTFNGTYVNLHGSQSMYGGDEFGIRGYFPKPGFENVTERDVRVMINGMPAQAPRIYLTGTTDRWNFEIIVRRQDMSSLPNNFRIEVPHDAVQPSVKAGETKDVSTLVDDYQMNVKLMADLDGADSKVAQNRLSSLSRRIQDSYKTLNAGQKRGVLKSLGSTLLNKELQSIDIFDSMHK